MNKDPRMQHSPATAVVHESEAQRQHPRIRLPATIELLVDGQPRRYVVHDLSAGGLAFDAQQDSFRVGQFVDGRLLFSVEPVAFSLPLRLQLRNFDPRLRRAGCAFQDLAPREVAVLRQVIGGYLAGELVTVGDVLTALGRDNFTRARAPKDVNAPLGAVARLRALLLTGLFFAVGLVACAYALTRLYDAAFVTRATVAKVAAPGHTLTMPRDGTFFSLVPADGRVKKGQPVGSFQAALLDFAQNDAASLQLAPEQLSELMGETLKGTLTSPCDCLVQRTFATDAQFVNRGQPLFRLVPLDFKPYVLARFHFDKLPELQPGRQVRFRIGGEAGTRSGRIARLRLLPGPLGAVAAAGGGDLDGLNSGGVTPDVMVEIEPAQALDSALVEQPVDVRVGALDLGR